MPDTMCVYVCVLSPCGCASLPGQVPVLAGSGLMSSAEDAVAAADKIGYPVLLKATGGGGGRGIFVCNNADEVLSQFSVSQKQGEQFFGNSGVSGNGHLKEYTGCCCVWAACAALQPGGERSACCPVL